MLKLRPNCECCDRDLPPESALARICSYECTFCAHCVRTKLGGICPNCGGEFVRRPVRTPTKLLKHPSSQRRVHRPKTRPGISTPTGCKAQPSRSRKNHFNSEPKPVII